MWLPCSCKLLLSESECPWNCIKPETRTQPMSNHPDQHSTQLAMKVSSQVFFLGETWVGIIVMPSVAVTLLWHAGASGYSGKLPVPISCLMVFTALHWQSSPLTCTLPLSIFSPSPHLIPPSKSISWWMIHSFHVIVWTSNTLYWKHQIDHQCLGQLRQGNRSRPL